MTVYTHRPRVSLPWWVLVFVLPFYLFSGTLWLSWWALALLVRVTARMWVRVVR